MLFGFGSRGLGMDENSLQQGDGRDQGCVRVAINSRAVMPARDASASTRVSSTRCETFPLLVYGTVQRLKRKDGHRVASNPSHAGLRDIVEHEASSDLLFFYSPVYAAWHDMFVSAAKPIGLRLPSLRPVRRRIAGRFNSSVIALRLIFYRRRTVKSATAAALTTMVARSKWAIRRRASAAQSAPA